MREWGDEKKLSVGRIKNQSPLKKTFADRTGEHQKGATGHGLPFQQAVKELRAAIIKKQREQPPRGQPAEQLGGPSQLADKPQDAPLEERSIQIEKRDVHWAIRVISRAA